MNIAMNRSDELIITIYCFKLNNVQNLANEKLGLLKPHSFHPPSQKEISIIPWELLYKGAVLN